MGAGGVALLKKTKTKKQEETLGGNQVSVLSAGTSNSQEMTLLNKKSIQLISVHVVLACAFILMVSPCFLSHHPHGARVSSIKQTRGELLLD